MAKLAHWPYSMAKLAHWPYSMANVDPCLWLTLTLVLGPWSCLPQPRGPSLPQPRGPSQPENNPEYNNIYS